MLREKEGAALPVRGPVGDRGSLLRKWRKKIKQLMMREIKGRVGHANYGNIVGWDGGKEACFFFASFLAEELRCFSVARCAKYLTLIEC